MKPLFTVAIIAIIIGGGYFFLRNEPSSTLAIAPLSNPSPVTDPATAVTALVTEPSTPPSQSPAPPASSSTAPAPAVKSNAVVYTNSGYAPKILKVAKGVIVIFKNQSSQAMWTASAMHPTHRVYPTTGGCLGSTFDACTGIQPNKSWSFKFDVAGTWKYHDHLNPRATGAIVVE